MERLYPQLRLENQLCFPLYACAKEIVRLYQPWLEPLGLTYTQYLVMLRLWETGRDTVKGLGEALWLDSGTLTPVLKKLEQKGNLIRARSEADERSVILSLTEHGAALQKQAADIPAQVGSCIPLKPDEAAQLYALLHKILAGLR